MQTIQTLIRQLKTVCVSLSNYFLLPRVTIPAHKTSIKNILMLHCRRLKCTEFLSKQIKTFSMQASTAFIIKSSIMSLFLVSNIRTVIFAICVKKEVDMKKALIAGNEKLQKSQSKKLSFIIEK